eukprot:2192495-Rhodomonas_salina.4
MHIGASASAAHSSRQSNQKSACVCLRRFKLAPKITASSNLMIISSQRCMWRQQLEDLGVGGEKLTRQKHRTCHARQ